MRCGTLFKAGFNAFQHFGDVDMLRAFGEAGAAADTFGCKGFGFTAEVLLAVDFGVAVHGFLIVNHKVAGDVYACGTGHTVTASGARHTDAVTDLLDPDKNIEAGVKHLRRLQNQLNSSGMEMTELIKFTLAAYNAGEGRIADCRNFASAKGYDNSSWDEIQKIIPLMREESILDEPSVKLGKFQGHETIAYIDSIMSHYEAICAICPAR